MYFQCHLHGTLWKCEDLLRYALLRHIPTRLLCRELSLGPKNTIIKTRIEEQNKYRPILNTKRLTNKELEVLRVQATEHVKILTMVRTDYLFKE